MTKNACVALLSFIKLTRRFYEAHFLFVKPLFPYEVVLHISFFLILIFLISSRFFHLDFFPFDFFDGYFP